MPGPLTPRQIEAALKVQEILRRRCIDRRTIEPDDIRTVAGADASYAGSVVCAAVVVVSYTDTGIVARATASTKTAFPYASGFFAFREGPALLKAFRTLEDLPDIAIFNGHGYAHPRRIGLASHIGVLLDIPSAGVAARPMIGEYEAPSRHGGATAPLMSGTERIGVAMRTREQGRPIVISAGHRTDLFLAEAVVRQTLRGGRMPLPVMEAHRCATALRESLRCMG